MHACLFILYYLSHQSNLIILWINIGSLTCTIICTQLERLPSIPTGSYTNRPPQMMGGARPLAPMPEPFPLWGGGVDGGSGEGEAAVGDGGPAGEDGWWQLHEGEHYGCWFSDRAHQQWCQKRGRGGNDSGKCKRPPEKTIGCSLGFTASSPSGDIVRASARWPCKWWRWQLLSEVSSWI